MILLIDDQSCEGAPVDSNVRTCSKIGIMWNAEKRSHYIAARAGPDGAMGAAKVTTEFTPTEGHKSS